jgi:diguanylate cyclase (GGDEF)-like protein/PAS domain S-box-containing protein
VTFLNPAVAIPNPYAVPVVLLALVVLGFGIAVLTREHASTIGWLFFLFSASVSTYFFGAGVSYSVVSAQDALIWERFAHVGVASIPVTMLTLSLAVTDTLQRLRVWAWLSITATIVFIIAILFTDLFIAGNTRHFWGFYPQYGPLGMAYLAYFSCVAIACLVIHHSARRRATTRLYRQRMTGFTIAFSIGYVGAVDFLPALGIEVFAFGYIPVAIFAVILGSVILRYRLIDITPAIAASQILSTMPSSVLVTNTLGTIRISNEAASGLFGRTTEEIVGKPVQTLLPLDGVEDEDNDAASPSLEQEMSGSREVRIERGDGTSRILSVRSTTLKDRRQRNIGRVYVAQDITEIKNATAALRRQALYDPLTGLPNRVLFFDRLEHLTRKLGRDGGSLAIFYVDLNSFKAINDTHGHIAGDTALQLSAQRMLSSTRSSDTLARIGGDEFAQICEGTANRDDAGRIAEKMLEKLDEPIKIGSETVVLGGAIGIAFFPEDGSTVQEIMIAADAAMYRAKAVHSSAYRFAEANDRDDSHRPG